MKSPALAVAAALALPGCVVNAQYQYFGVELAPEAPGWKDELAVGARGVPVQFHWESGDVHVAIANWEQDPTYFMVYVTSRSDQPIGVRVRGVEQGPHGSIDIFGPERHARTEALEPAHWVDVPARGSLQFWIAGLDWLDDPQVGDRIDAAIDLDPGMQPSGAVLTCPLKFRVARVHR